MANKTTKEEILQRYHNIIDAQAILLENRELFSKEDFESHWKSLVIMLQGVYAELMLYNENSK